MTQKTRIKSLASELSVYFLNNQDKKAVQIARELAINKNTVIELGRAWVDPDENSLENQLNKISISEKLNLIDTFY